MEVSENNKEDAHKNFIVNRCVIDCGAKEYDVVYKVENFSSAHFGGQNYRWQISDGL